MIRIRDEMLWRIRSSIEHWRRPWQGCCQHDTSHRKAQEPKSLSKWAGTSVVLQPASNVGNCACLFSGLLFSLIWDVKSVNEGNLRSSPCFGIQRTKMTNLINSNKCHTSDKETETLHFLRSPILSPIKGDHYPSLGMGYASMRITSLFFFFTCAVWECIFLNIQLVWPALELLLFSIMFVKFIHVLFSASSFLISNDVYYATV